MKRGKAKRKSPSREKYERNNPVVSHRVPKELHDKLQAAKEKQGLSYTDILKIGLGLLEPKIQAEEQVREKAYEKGWEVGFKKAEELYAVSYNCRGCGKKIWVDTDEEKKDIARHMREAGWCHRDCSNPAVYLWPW